MLELTTTAKSAGCCQFGGRPESAFCITIYNEKLSKLHSTLSSILTSVSTSAADERTSPKSVYVCLILDGVDRTDPNMLVWLDEAGLLKKRVATSLDDCETYQSTMRNSNVLRMLDDTGLNNLSPELDLKFIVCLKQVNCGKLHSHAVFFSDICSVLKPTYCIQLDVGTVIAADAYLRLIHRMERDPAIGAIAPCITTTDPYDEAPFISTWQHMDFVVQKSMFWPFEVASGYLSVIPGQFCIMRHAALMPDDCDNDRQTKTADELSPIQAYLRGLTTKNPLEKIMFLAEDRVIGSEIVLRKNAEWHLEYCSETRAVTDTCLTVPELMRQRRRWSNSALACRLWLLCQISRFLCRNDRSHLSKARFIVAMIGQAMLMVREFASPAITLSSILVFARIGRHLAEAGQWGWQTVLNICFGGIILGCLIPKYVRDATVSRASLIVRGVLGIVLAFLLAGMLGFGVSSKTAMVLVLLPGGLSLIAMLLVFRARTGRIFMMLGVYIVTDAILAPAISAYSTWKLNDVSWGTKGLTTSPQDILLARRMDRLRLFGVSAWLLINGVLVVAAMSFPGVTSTLLNPVFEAICALNIWVYALVLFRLGRQAFRELRWAQAAPRPAPAGRDDVVSCQSVRPPADASANF